MCRAEGAGASLRAPSDGGRHSGESRPAHVAGQAGDPAHKEESQRSYPANDAGASSAPALCVLLPRTDGIM